MFYWLKIIFSHRVTCKEGAIRPISCICYIVLLDLHKQNTRELN